MLLRNKTKKETVEKGSPSREIQTPEGKTAERERYSLAYTQLAIDRIVDDLKKSGGERLTEADTCNRLVLPFFQAFGWNTSNELWHCQFAVGGSRRHVDYAFSKNGHGWAYIEAKRLLFKNIDSNKNFIKQISGYFNASPGAHLIILTNGEEYCFYSYGETTEICTTPFIKFNIRNIDVTGNASFLRHLFRNGYNIGDWSKYAEMSRALAEIRHSLRKAPDCLTKQHLIEKSFALLYPEYQEAERKELIGFFTAYS